jgi:hypothetical protein
MAAKEIRRYLCLRTGLLWPLRLDDAAPEQNWILVGTKHRRSVQTLLADPALKESVQGLAEQEFVLRTVRHGNRVVWLIAGGDGIGAFYGAYRFAEHLGVRFYLHGDVLPDTQTALQLPDLNEIAKPLFRLRGIQPFHDFPEGPDWWNADAYKAVLGQLPKLRMNFFGLHTYPAGQVGPEPTVWIGLAGEIGPGATVKSSYPARHFTTLNTPSPEAKPAWGYRPAKTGDYYFGADALRYGCTGLMGIHWRTRIVGPNISALAQAAWDQTPWKSPQTDVSLPPPDGKPEERQRQFQPERHAPCTDFCADWALAQFGPEVAQQTAALWARLDGRLPALAATGTKDVPSLPNPAGGTRCLSDDTGGESG